MSTMRFKYADKDILFHTPNSMTQRRVKGIFSKEPITIEWLNSMKKNEVLIDIGANVGMYSCMAAVGREVNVYAFEPEAQNYALLVRNSRLNKVTSTMLSYCTGILDYDGFNVLNIGDRWKEDVLGGSGHSVEEQLTYNMNPMNLLYSQGTTVTRLDTFCEKNNVQPTHIKIDVDGLEHRVVNGALKSFDVAKTVLIELDTTLEHHRNIVNIMKDLKFTVDMIQVKAALRGNGFGEHLFFK